MFCPKCGNQNADTVKFCAYCGTLLNQATDPVPQAEIAEPVPAPVAEPVAVEIPAEAVPQAEETPQEQPKKKRSKGLKIFLICLSILVVLGGAAAALIFTHVICLTHEFRAATCTEAQVCVYCEKTQGEPLGHDWSVATCTAPKFCYVCDLTDGEALGHKWQDADCVTPQVCSVCNEKTGEPLGHKWIEATCTEPQTCSVCEVVGETSLGHTPGEWVTTQEATFLSAGTQTCSCTVCNALLDQRSIDKREPAVEGDEFNMTDQEFIDWIHENSTVIVNPTDISTPELGEENTAYAVTLVEGDAGLIILNHDDNGTDGRICAVMVYFENPSASTALAVWIGTKFDPRFSSDAAIEALVADQLYSSSDLSVGYIPVGELSVCALVTNEFILSE